MQCINHPEVDQDIVRCLRCQQAFCPDCVVMLRGYWYCGPCKDEQVRDIQSGTTSTFELASVGRRIVAAMLDVMVETIALMLIAIPLYLVFVAGIFATGAASGREPSGGGMAVMMVGMLGMYAVIFVA